MTSDREDRRTGRYCSAKLGFAALFCPSCGRAVGPDRPVDADGFRSPFPLGEGPYAYGMLAFVAMLFGILMVAALHSPQGGRMPASQSSAGRP